MSDAMISRNGTVELTTQEIVDRLDGGARSRLGISAKEMIRAFRDQTLEDSGGITDLIILAGLLSEDHPLYVEP